MSVAAREDRHDASVADGRAPLGGEREAGVRMVKEACFDRALSYWFRMNSMYPAAAILA